MLVSVLKKYFYVAGIDDWDLFFFSLFCLQSSPKF